MATNTFQDGYQLNTDGQWITNGLVQTKNIGNVSNSRSQQVKQSQNQAKNSSNDTSKKNVLNLFDTLPSFNISHNLRTNNNELWKNCIGLERNYYKAFTLNGDYTEISFKYAPLNDFSKYNTYTISILGDDDSPLWESDEITNETPTQSATVDVSGQDEIRFFITGDTYAGTILFKDMYAE